MAVNVQRPLFEVLAEQRCVTGILLEVEVVVVEEWFPRIGPGRLAA